MCATNSTANPAGVCCAPSARSHERRTRSRTGIACRAATMLNPSAGTSGPTAPPAPFAAAPGAPVGLPAGGAVGEVAPAADDVRSFLLAMAASLGESYSRTRRAGPRGAAPVRAAQSMLMGDGKRSATGTCGSGDRCAAVGTAQRRRVCGTRYPGMRELRGIVHSRRSPPGRKTYPAERESIDCDKPPKGSAERSQCFRSQGVSGRSPDQGGAAPRTGSGRTERQRSVATDPLPCRIQRQN